MIFRFDDVPFLHRSKRWSRPKSAPPEAPPILAWTIDLIDAWALEHQNGIDHREAIMKYKTTVVRIREVPKAIYIGRERNRPNHFGNPFSHLNLNHTIKVESRQASIIAFREWLQGDPKWSNVEPDRREWILKNIQRLRGQQLGCFCAPKPCHGDVIAAWLEQT